MQPESFEYKNIPVLISPMYYNAAQRYWIFLDGHPLCSTEDLEVAREKAKYFLDTCYLQPDICSK